MHEHLFRQISETHSLAARDIEACYRYFEPVEYPKNTLLEAIGRVPKYLYYVVSGHTRIFHYDSQGNDITTHFNCPPGFMTPYADYLNRTVSEEGVETITPAGLLRISRNNLDKLMAESPGLQAYNVYALQQSMFYNETRTKELATLTAEQRYLRFMEKYPDTLLHVPLLYIASFLGMNPKSLSRIRRQIKQ